MKRNGDWILTGSGRRFWPCDPQADEIVIEDIAHHLSNICRFTGATRCHYSVAQHSLLCSTIVPECDAKWGLLHDASEAYLSDVSRPVKPFLSNYRTLEKQLMRVVAEKFKLCWPIPESVHRADNILVLTERRDLLPAGGPSWGDWTIGVELLGQKIEPVSQPEAEQMFLRRYHQLFGGEDG